MAAQQKIRLIEAMNPHWRDLAESWMDVYKLEVHVPATAAKWPLASPRAPPEEWLRSG